MEEKDYKKLYEDVVALAKDGLHDGLYLSQSAKAVTEFLFPQLKETEDEKVRRELTRFLINFNNGYYSKPSETEIDSWVKWINKKCGQKPTDKAEPKFKAGDWVRAISSGNIFKILSVNDGLYRVLCYDGVEANYPIEVEKDLAYWTIQDAKEGDVLAAHECYVIFKEIDGGNIKCYCAYHYMGFNPSFYVDTLQNKNAFYPATKEQRNLLFAKMKEAGYEWGADKKELRKVEQNPAWSEEDEYQINTILHGLDLKRELYKKEGNKVEEDRYNTQYNWLKSIKNRLQPKQEWSKEDEQNLKGIIATMEEDAQLPSDTVKRLCRWLKSLNPQSHWKPSEEQMEALFEAKLASINNREYFLGLLYEDLKKL